MIRPFVLAAAVAVLSPAHLLAQSAASSSGPIPRAVFILTMDGEFRKIDANGDGQLTRSEIEQFQRAAQLARAQAQSRQMFTALDADRNGQISPTEFAKLNLTAPSTDASVLLRFDTGGDGKISLIEHRTATVANFDRLDNDKDGIVTAAEMKAGGITR